MLKGALILATGFALGYAKAFLEQEPVAEWYEKRPVPNNGIYLPPNVDAIISGEVDGPLQVHGGRNITLKDMNVNVSDLTPPHIIFHPQEGESAQ